MAMGIVAYKTQCAARFTLAVYTRSMIDLSTDGPIATPSLQRGNLETCCNSGERVAGCGRRGEDIVFHPLPATRYPLRTEAAERINAFLEKRSQ